jgi:phage tail sheath gpL-like
MSTIYNVLKLDLVIMIINFIQKYTRTSFGDNDKYMLQIYYITFLFQM